MKTGSIYIAIFLCFASSMGHAQSDISFDEAAIQSFGTATNAFVTLESDDTLSAGSYKFKNTSPGVTASDLDLYKYVWEFEVGSSDGQFIPLIEITPAYLEYKEVSEEILKSTAKVSGLSLGVGAGLRMKFFKDALKVTPRIKAEYADLDYDFDITGLDDSSVDNLIPDVKTWSYIPSIEVEVTQPVSDNGSFLSFGSKISLNNVNASTSNNNISDFSNDTWVLRNHLTYETSFSLGSDIKEVIFRPSIGRVDVHGAARDGFGFNNFYEFGAELVSQNILKNIFKETGVAATYIYEQEVQGWRLGFVVKFN